MEDLKGWEGYERLPYAEKWQGSVPSENAEP